MDSVDPEWIFFQREQDIKTRLYRRYLDKARQQLQLESLEDTEPSLQQKVLYSKSKISEKVGRAVQESPQALAATRFDWLEVQRSYNKGAPQAMTTVVANAHTSDIAAHVVHGPCADPCPEHTVLSMARRKPFDYNLADHACVQTASYLRRRDQWMSIAYQRHFDTQRGRVKDRTRRTEAQKRGHLHDHIVEYHEKCGLLFPGSGARREPGRRLFGPGPSGSAPDIFWSFLTSWQK